jgi:hypothetical protein
MLFVYQPMGGAVTLTRADLMSPPEMANRVDDPVTEIVPAVAVMVAHTGFRARRFSRTTALHAVFVGFYATDELARAGA